MPKFKNALISVSDKTGLVDFVKPLFESGTRIVSTGGTAKALRDAGIKTVDVSEQTGYPEVMDGRVKTLHPRVHMALLARAGNAEDKALLEKEGLEPFDLLVVNLYPFEKTLQAKASDEDLIENIDIGGPSLLRAAAKNMDRITVVVDPGDYAHLLSANEISATERRRLAAKAFVHVSSYDAMISQALAPQELFPQFSLGGQLVKELRYGENPHQKARWYRRRGALSGWHDAEILQGKELSYNNLLDLEASVLMLRELSGSPAAVGVKHNNPCGVARGATIEEAAERCLAADPVSVFGGIVALNQEVSAGVAEILNKIFLECVVAPRFSPDALKIFAKKKNLRLLSWPGWADVDGFYRVQSLQGGFLVQGPDRVHAWNPEWQVLGESPSTEIRSDLSLAWAVVAQLKSNAIAVTENNQTLGLGMGQVNRVDAVEHAIERMGKFHPQRKSPVLASDAFFPFTDSIEKIHAAGIRWVIQPGGSVRDDEVFAKAKELGVNLILTGQRHFRH